MFRTLLRSLVAIAPPLVAGAHAQSDTFWTNPAGGSWFAAGNWSGGQIPNNVGGESFNAHIDLVPALAYTVVLDNSATISNLDLNSIRATLRASAGTFQVLGSANLSAGTFNLNGATLLGGVWNAGGAGISIGTSANSRLSGLTWNGDLPLSTSGAQLKIQNGLQLNGQMTLSASNTAVTWEGVQTLAGGTVLLNPSSGSAALNLPTGAELTLSPTTTIRGGTGSFSGAGRLINEGLIRADRAGTTLTVGPASFTNHAALEGLANTTLTIGGTSSTWNNMVGATINVTSGTLNLLGTWSNSGAIVSNGATVNLGGSFATPSLAGFQRTGGTVNLTGTLSNAGQSVVLDSTSGPWNLRGGTISGGTFSVPDDMPLVIAGTGVGTLSGVNFSGPVSMASGSGLLIDPNSTLPSRVDFSASGARLGFGGQRVLNGLQLNLGSQTNSISVENSGQLTLGPSQRIEGNVQILSGVFSSGLESLVRNEGLIRGAGSQVIEIAPDRFENTGLCEVSGGTLRLGYLASNSSPHTWVNLPGGVVRATNATLDLGGNWSNNGTIEAVNSTVNLRGAFRFSDLMTFSRQGGTVTLWGALDNTGANLTLNQQTGSWNMIGGSITGGTLSFADGANLTFERPTSSAPTSQFFGVTINGDLSVRSNSSWTSSVYLDRATVINGTLGIGRNASVRLEPNREWAAPIVFDGGPFSRLTANQPGQLTFAAGTLLRGNGGTIEFTQGASALNRGTIRCDVPSESFILSGQITNEGQIEGRNGGGLSITTTNQQTFTNAASGVISVDPDGDLQLAGNWQNHGLIALSGADATLHFRPENNSRNFGTIQATNSNLQFVWGFRNSGTIRAVNSAVDFNCDFTTSDLGGFERSGGTVRLIGTLDNTGAVFRQNALTGPWILGTSGVIRGGVIEQTDGVNLQFGTDNNTGTLDGVTMRGDMLLNGSVRINNGLTMESGVVRISHGSYLRVSGGVTLDNMTVEFNDTTLSNPSPTLAVLAGAPLVLGPGFLAHGGYGRFGQDLGVANDPGLINRGTITADRPGRRISIENQTFTNEGLLSTANGGMLRIGSDAAGRTWTNAATGQIIASSGTIETAGVWSNAGDFEAHNATVRLGGQYTHSSLESVTLDNSQLFIQGQLDNSGHNLAIDSFRSTHWTLAGLINGGSITCESGAPLRSNAASLRNVNLEGELRFLSSARIIGGEGGMHLDDVFMGESGGEDGIYFFSPATIRGPGQIVLSAANAEFFVTTSPNGTLTINSDVLIHGGHGTVGRVFGGSASVVNNGTISADESGRTIRVLATDTARVTNNGLIEARNGGRLWMPNPQNLANRAGSQLIGGRWAAYAGSTIDLPSSAITINSADVLLSGPGSLFSAIDPLSDNRGRFTLDSGRDFSTVAGFLNSGTLRLGDGSTLTVAGALTQSISGVLEVELGGVDPPTQFGSLAVTGNATLAGVLDVDLVNGFSPQYGDSFRVLVAASRSGEFLAVYLPELSGDLFFQIAYRPGAVDLLVVPEPASIGIAGLLVVAASRTRRRV